MRLGILGPLLIGDGAARITAGRDRVVLAMLLLRADRVVPIDDLVDAVWEDNPPDTARGQLQTCVSRLRRTLAAAGLPAGAIATDPAGYLLRLEPGLSLDALTFTGLVRRAQDAEGAGRLAEAANLFRTALDLWRGPALAGITAAAVRRAAAALDEQRLLAVEDWLEVELRLGRDRDLLGELTDLVDRQPLRERLRSQLMRALCGAGRQAEALAVYRRGRELLREELGVEPGPLLQETHRRVLAGEIGVAGDRREHPPVRALPRSISDFTGRDDEVARLTKEVDEAGVDGSVVQAIDGMPGSGKTTLALHVAGLLAHRFPDAHLYLDLRGHSRDSPLSPSAALAALLRQIGVPGDRIPACLEDRVLLWRGELAVRRVLLVLDNAASPAQVSPLLPTGPGCLTLVTSRRRMIGLDGVRPRSLAVLAPTEAVELLARVAGTDRVRSEPAAAAEVVRRCGYLPLAIRLAGARLAHRPQWLVADLLARLGDDGPVLAEFAVEHRRLVDAFALSYAQLTEPAQRTFRLLGCFPGTEFEAPVPAALTGLTLPATREALTELVDAHLVDEPAAGRFRLHDLVRAYAAELVSGDPDDGRRRIARHHLLDLYLHVAARFSRVLEPETGQAPFVSVAPLRPELVDGWAACVGRDWLGAERVNLVTLVTAAAEHGFPEYAWQLARALWRHLFVSGHFDEIITTHTEGLRAAAVLGDERATASMRNYLASAYYRLGQYQRAIDLLRPAVAIRERLGDQAGQVGALHNVAISWILLGRMAEAEAALDRGMELARRGAETAGMPQALRNVGGFYNEVGRHLAALTVLRHALFLYRQLGSRAGLANSLGELGLTYARLGDHRRAGPRLRLALRLQRTIGNRFGAAELLNEIGALECALGRPQEALARYREALVIMRTIDVAGECASYNGLGAALLDLGDVGTALDMHRQALRRATAIQHPREQARALAGIGACLRGTDPVTARSHYVRALVLFEQICSPERPAVRRRIAELTPPGTG
ncbi:BTAD domain-containing putative transcriptional regulator [Solwaraspora sp. WMMD1047]|uniref:AfsR/SARP family transcriptional regulator n=1 Tax=Solwaraspora sp. WMMD1047 TaxID=3016102 RepID=UPI002416C64E|nr:BTAD domain-containing putative transcriptional regulator [Solwaraspora sp. WMMD1047]MDG4828149.1 BTAD domain-containing putative transcriptional regulator [Solwaraspora sp. WMMD1047]